MNVDDTNSNTSQQTATNPDVAPFVPQPPRASQPPQAPPSPQTSPSPQPPRAVQPPQPPITPVTPTSQPQPSIPTKQTVVGSTSAPDAHQTVTPAPTPIPSSPETPPPPPPLTETDSSAQANENSGTNFGNGLSNGPTTNHTNNNEKPTGPNKKPGFLSGLGSGKLKMVIGSALMLLIIVGGGAAFYLSQHNQDIRQDASTGSCQWPKPSHNCGGWVGNMSLTACDNCADGENLRAEMVLKTCGLSVDINQAPSLEFDTHNYGTGGNKWAYVKNIKVDWGDGNVETTKVAADPFDYKENYQGVKITKQAPYNSPGSKTVKVSAEVASTTACGNRWYTDVTTTTINVTGSAATATPTPTSVSSSGKPKDSVPPNKPKNLTANATDETATDNGVRFSWEWNGDNTCSGCEGPVNYCNIPGDASTGTITGNHEATPNDDSCTAAPFWWHVLDKDAIDTDGDGQVSYEEKRLDYDYHSNKTSVKVSCDGKPNHTLLLDVKARDARGNIDAADSGAVRVEYTCPPGAGAGGPQPTATPTPTPTPTPLPTPPPDGACGQTCEENYAPCSPDDPDANTYMCWNGFCQLVECRGESCMCDNPPFPSPNPNPPDGTDDLGRPYKYIWHKKDGTDEVVDDGYYYWAPTGDHDDQGRAICEPVRRNHNPSWDYEKYEGGEGPDGKPSLFGCAGDNALSGSDTSPAAPQCVNVVLLPENPGLNGTSQVTCQGTPNVKYKIEVQHDGGTWTQINSGEETRSSYPYTFREPGKYQFRCTLYR